MSKACDKDIKTRANADELLKHKWFRRKNLSLNIARKLVQRVQPLIDAQRDAARKAYEDKENNNSYNDHDDYDYYDDSGDDWSSFDRGTTMLEEMYAEDVDNVNKDGNDEYSSIRSKKGKILHFESVFKGNKYIDKCLEIPKDVKKTELVEIWHAVRNTSRKDKKIFEEFYKCVLDQLDDMLLN